MITIMDENKNCMTLTHLLSLSSLNLRVPFIILLLLSKQLIAFLDVHTRGEYASPLCITCMLMPQIIPFLIFTLICMWHEESTP